MEYKYYLGGQELTLQEFCNEWNKQYYTKEVLNGNEVHLVLNEERKKTALRRRRAILFEAFDIYKSNVQYGIDTETLEEHVQILAWYNNLKDLQEVAFTSIPEVVKKYLRG